MEKTIDGVKYWGVTLVARRSETSYPVVLGLLRSGEIPGAVRVGRTWWIPAGTVIRPPRRGRPHTKRVRWGATIRTSWILSRAPVYQQRYGDGWALELASLALRQGVYSPHMRLHVVRAAVIREWDTILTAEKTIF